AVAGAVAGADADAGADAVAGAGAGAGADAQAPIPRKATMNSRLRIGGTYHRRGRVDRGIRARYEYAMLEWQLGIRGVDDVRDILADLFEARGGAVESAPGDPLLIVGFTEPPDLIVIDATNAWLE